MSPTTRRNGGSSAITGKLGTRDTDADAAIPSKPPSQFQPSPYLLLIYPFILALGSFFSTFSPTASHTGALTPGVASEINTAVNSEPVNYFASKHNLINVYFVKIGWFWTTLAFALLAYNTHAIQPPRLSPSSSKIAQAVLRYTIATITWIGTTQWLFGPPLIDRSFTLTGGRCEALPAKIDDEGRPDVSAIVTGIACKAVGGRWKGGTDISGHVFLLVLSSAFLLLELYIADALSPHPHVTPRAAAAVAHDTTEEEKRELGGWESDTQAKIRLWTRYFVWGVVMLDVWMLLMTAIWFHTWLEKLSGLLISGFCIWGIYFLPAYLPAWSDIVGPI